MERRITHILDAVCAREAEHMNIVEVFASDHLDTEYQNDHQQPEREPARMAKEKKCIRTGLTKVTRKVSQPRQCGDLPSEDRPSARPGPLAAERTL